MRAKPAPVKNRGVFPCGMPKMQKVCIILLNFFQNVL